MRAYIINKNLKIQNTGNIIIIIIYFNYISFNLFLLTANKNKSLYTKLLNIIITKFIILKKKL